MGLRVCYVVNSVSETSVPATIATALVDHTDVSVDLLAWFRANSFTGEDRVSAINLDAPRTTTGIDRLTYRATRDALRDYDLVQVHHNHSGSFAKVIAASLDLPIVSREGNTRNGFTRKGRIANGLTNALADRIVCNSRAVYDSFTRWERLLIDDDRVVHIPNGVDLDRIEWAHNSDWGVREEFDIPTESIVVGTACVITDQKAIDTLVQAMRIANERSDRRLDLVIVGDGPRRQHIEYLVNEERLGDRVHVTGMVDRDTVYQVLTQLDVYAMPSRWEGFANAAVEALGARNACVFSDIDPFTIPYRDVAMFHPVDDADALASRVLALANDCDLRATYEYKGRVLVEREYTIDRIANQYADLYDELA